MSISRAGFFSTLLRRTTRRRFCTTTTPTVTATDSADDESSTSTNYAELAALSKSAEEIITDIYKLANEIQDKDVIGKLEPELAEEFYWHPFRKGGNNRAYVVKVRENDWFARVDMPGIGTKGVRVWFQDNYLHFKGEVTDSKEIEEDAAGGRMYSRGFYIPRGEYQTDKIDAVLKNGVLKITIPKIQS